MPKQLFENDFPTTVNLKNLQKPTDFSANNKVDDKVSYTPQKISRQQITNWGIELKNRLTNNSKLSPETRKTVNEIELAFFNDFFNTFWEPECADQLMSLGTPLRQAFKVLGFDFKTNPILGFICLKYVKENLIKTKLLNVNTFKAIYNAVANQLVADSEFLKVNDYNIIYCKNLYTKSAKEMQEYLKIQKNILETNVSTYTLESQMQNKKVFIHFNKIKGFNSKFKNDAKKYAEAVKSLQLDPKKLSVRKATLNSLEQANAILTAFGRQVTGNEETTTHLSTKSQTNIVNKLNEPSEILAALLYLGMTTDSTKVEKALNNDKLRSVPTDKLLKAISWLDNSGIMPKGRLKTLDADSLIDIILGKL